MRCNSKRIFTFLITSALTFVFSVGTTIVWRNSTHKNEDALQNRILPGQKITLKVVSPEAFQENNLNQCEEVKSRSGGKALNKQFINPGVLNGKSCFVEPIYPKEAVENNISGQVNVEVTVDGYGIVRAAQAISGDELLRQSAVEAAYKTRVVPIYLRGEPVNVKGLLVYKFVLPK